VVIVERAEPEQVGAVAAQRDPLRLGEPLHGDLGLQALQLGRRHPRHIRPSRKPVKTQAVSLCDAKSALMRDATTVRPVASWAEMPFAERVAALRKERGLTQNTLASRVGIHVTLLRRYEAGTTQPGIDVLRRIALALSVPADVLLFDEGERGPDDELRMDFEAASSLPADDRRLIHELIEGLRLKREVRRLVSG